MSKSKNLVPCLAWVKKGCAKQKPDKVTIEKEELRRIIEESQNKLDADDASDNDMSDDEQDAVAAAIEKSQKVAGAIKTTPGKVDKRKRKQDDSEDADDIVKKYGLKDYDNEESAPDFSNSIGGLTPFASNEEDPYITLKDDVDSDEEDFILKSTDNLLVLGRITEEAAILEVHIYNEELNNLFVHHDYILPTFPLVSEWMDFDVADGSKGNFIALGTMEPDIGIWDLDVVDSLEPVCVLKGKKKLSKKKEMKKKDNLTDGHSSSVLDLSWNRNVRNVLASASADRTVCLWDLAEGKVVSTLRHHEKEVQCVTWHPVEQQLLLTGSFDNYAAVTDCRTPLDSVKKWKFDGEIERALWNHFSPFHFLASTEKGMLYAVDIRQEKPLFTLSAHEQEVTGISLSSQIPGLLVTTSPDKYLKVWDIQDSKPSLILSRNLKMDILHCVSCNPDHPFVFAIGGNKDFKVWDIRESAAVRRHFLSRMPAPLAAECAGDDEDLPEDTAADAMADLNMDDDEDMAEEEEMMTGDRGLIKASQSTNGGLAKKKKRKRKKKHTAPM
ncbi:periodic tryptophan protein 1 [Biomphalaria pfeifferi]|uniref:Periodic tryptophan protein 1 n=1 Tax=Biomphalaria pfeifferi TaxID=112525 RepID=A0AAD8BFN4_BIOPF|nr:periodic tryptophan protein 1 [Biomphalaria pfeifferi]